MTPPFTSLDRVLTTLNHSEPDRLPCFLTLTMHGARELGMSIEHYFSRAENVVEGQLRMLAKYQNDFVYTLFYAAIEVEALGGAVIYREDGPPNCGAPIIKTPADIAGLRVPIVEETPCLAKVLESQRMLRSAVGSSVPIVGIVISPFSVPVMQLGFEKYLDLMLDSPADFWSLMAKNEEFCVAWANAQLEAGATAIGYFDPVASPTIIPRATYRQTGFEVARRTIARIKGPVAVHLGSGRVGPIADDLCQVGGAIIGVSAQDDLAALMRACRGKVTVMGNLNGVEMRRWTPEQAEREVKASISRAGAGGGFILADNHGEIPWQVPDQVLLRISEAAQEWGRYPLDWASRNE